MITFVTWGKKVRLLTIMEDIKKKKKLLKKSPVISTPVIAIKK